jgi:hypothetical protein
VAFIHFKATSIGEKNGDYDSTNKGFATVATVCVLGLFLGLFVVNKMKRRDYARIGSIAVNTRFARQPLPNRPNLGICCQ